MNSVPSTPIKWKTKIPIGCLDDKPIIWVQRVQYNTVPWHEFNCVVLTGSVSKILAMAMMIATSMIQLMWICSDKKNQAKLHPCCVSHRDRVTQLNVTDSDNDLSPNRRQVIIWTKNAAILLTVNNPYKIRQSEITLFEHGDLAVCLTHLSLDHMTAISQPIFWNTFSWMKRFVFWIDNCDCYAFIIISTKGK